MRADNAWQANQSVRTHDFVVVPTPVTNLRSTGRTHNSVTLAWNASPGATGYRVYNNWTFVRSVTGTSTTVTGLPADTQHTFRVVATHAVGNSYSASVGVRTLIAPPPMPGNLRMTNRNQTSITIAWNASARAAHYRVYRNGVFRTTTTGTSWTASGLSANTRHDFRVVAVNSTGNSAAATNSFWTETAVPMRFWRPSSTPPPSPQPGPPPPPPAFRQAVVATHNFRTGWLFRWEWPWAQINTNPDAAAIRRSLLNSGFSIDHRTNFTRDTLISVLNAHVVVLSGHGSPDTIKVGRSDNAVLWSHQIPSIRHNELTVLMTCRGAQFGTASIAGRFVSQGATTSLGFTENISDITATPFIRSLFSHLEAGRTVVDSADRAETVAIDGSRVFGALGIDSWSVLGDRDSRPLR